MEPDESVRVRGGDRQWYIVGRWQEYKGEAQANLLRIVAIGGFYAVELLNYYGLHVGNLVLRSRVTATFHQTVTALAVAWVGVALVVLYCLRRRVFPAAMKYLSTAADLLLLTATFMVADGMRSPLVPALFVVIAMAGLRFSLGLVRFATGGAIGVYVVVLIYSRWITQRDLRVPHYHALLMLLALTLCGIILGQVIRRVRAMAEEYTTRRAAHPEQPS